MLNSTWKCLITFQNCNMKFIYFNMHRKFSHFPKWRSENFYAKFMQAVKMLALCIHKIYILQTLKCNRSNITGSNKTNSSRIFPLFLSLMSAMIWAFISHMLFTQKNERAVNENVVRLFHGFSLKGWRWFEISSIYCTWIFHSLALIPWFASILPHCSTSIFSKLMEKFFRDSEMLTDVNCK